MYEDIIDNITEKIRELERKVVVDDIIDIYIGKYDTYEEYLIQVNKRNIQYTGVDCVVDVKSYTYAKNRGILEDEI